MWVYRSSLLVSVMKEPYNYQPWYCTDEIWAEVCDRIERAAVAVVRPIQVD